MFQKHHPGAGARPGTLIVPSDSPRPILRRVRYSRDALCDEILTLDRLAVRFRRRPALAGGRCLVPRRP